MDRLALILAALVSPDGIIFLFKLWLAFVIVLLIVGCAGGPISGICIVKHIGQTEDGTGAFQYRCEPANER